MSERVISLDLGVGAMMDRQLWLCGGVWGKDDA